MNIPIDKLLHLMVGALIFAALLPFGFWIAVGASLAAACGKELYDLAHRTNHTPDLVDAEVTALGTATAAAWLCIVVPIIKGLL